jgi:hypothetical protein
MEMKEIYETALENEHVDHIVPLKSNEVCGLHVPWNLQKIGAGANLHKSNNWWPDMWTEPRLLPLPILPPFQTELPL